MSKLRIGIDMGHTLIGTGTGAVGCGYEESKETRVIGKKLVALLEANNCEVINCTVDKSNNQLTDRVAIANRSNLDLFVSIHLNSSAYDEKGNGRTTGVECWVGHTGTKAYDEAIRTCANIAKLGLANRGVKVNGQLTVLKGTKAPAYLIEICFIDDKDDMNVYVKNTDKIAKAIAEAILNKSLDTVVQPPKKGVYRVVVDSYADRDNAVAKQEELRKKGIDTFLVYTEI